MTVILLLGGVEAILEETQQVTEVSTGIQEELSVPQEATIPGVTVTVHEAITRAGVPVSETTTPGVATPGVAEARPTRALVTPI